MKKQKDTFIGVRIPNDMKSKISLVTDTRQQSEYIRHLIRKDLSERFKTT